MVLLALNYNCSNKKKMSQFEKKIHPTADWKQTIFFVIGPTPETKRRLVLYTSCASILTLNFRKIYSYRKIIYCY